jgi:biopolymer transport protein ExbB/biopolymer transport protein TolQ
MGLLYFLVTRDFLLPERIRAKEGVGWQLIAVSWIICVSSASVAIFAWITRVVPETAKTLRKVWDNIPQVSPPYLPDIWSRMGYPQRSVAVLLFVESIWSLAVIIDRFLYFSDARKQSRRFATFVASALSEGKLDEAIKIAGQNRGSHLAEVVGAGLREFRDSSGADGQETIVGSQRALKHAETIVFAKLRRGLSVLASISATAPLLAALGAIVGKYSGDKSSSLVIISLGIAVAIVTVTARSYFVSRVEAFGLEMDNSSNELIDYFVKLRGSNRGKA